MKKLLTLLFTLPLFIACSSDDNEDGGISNPSNFSITVTSSDGDQDIHISAYLFKTDNVTFSEIQNISDLRQYSAVDIYGDTHHAFYSFSSDNSFIKHPVLKGGYALYVIDDKTGRYTFKQLTIESGENYFLEKEFKPSTPNGAYEEW